MDEFVGLLILAVACIFLGLIAGRGIAHDHWVREAQKLCTPARYEACVRQVQNRYGKLPAWAVNEQVLQRCEPIKKNPWFVYQKGKARP